MSKSIQWLKYAPLSFVFSVKPALVVQRTGTRAAGVCQRVFTRYALVFAFSPNEYLQLAYLLQVQGYFGDDVGALWLGGVGVLQPHMHCRRSKGRFCQVISC